MGSFRFSPRANRAGDIAWWEWSEAAFQKAREEDKPVLLSLSAVWCHWCHVMDETSYSDGENIRLINDFYVPIRVDNDQRPDINQRYNMGGWPTTAFLTPDGHVLGGGTYIPPGELRRLLELVRDVYHSRKGDIAQAVAERRQRQDIQETTDHSLEPSLDIVQEVVSVLAQGFDSQHGGFGQAPKFPEADALDLLLFYHRLTGEPAYLTMVLHTLQSMANGGLFDVEERGFFRYSTTADWSVPHYEKMLEDNARLLAVYLTAFQVTGDPSLAHTASGVLDYLLTSLHDPEMGGFWGSQDADEAYYRLPLQERRHREPPLVDRTVYTSWNGRAVVACLQAARVLGRPQARVAGLRALDFLWRRCRHPGPAQRGHPTQRDGRSGGMFHYYDGRAHLSGLFTDQVEMARALVAAYEDTGRLIYLGRAQRLASVMERDFAHPQGLGFFDRAADTTAQGYLGHRLHNLEDNATAAEVFRHLYLWTGEARYRERARGALRAFVSGYHAYGRLAAGYAGAVARALHPAVLVKVARADSPRGRDLQRASLGLGYPNILVRPLSRAEATGARPYALVCLEDRCLPPITEAAELGPSLAELVASAG